MDNSSGSGGDCSSFVWANFDVDPTISPAPSVDQLSDGSFRHKIQFEASSAGCGTTVRNSTQPQPKAYPSAVPVLIQP